MRYISATLVIFSTIFASLSFSASAQEEARPPVIALFQSNNRVLVMLTVGDHPPVPAVFDTGTNGNIVDMDVATRMGLENRGPSTAIDGSTGNPVPGFATYITGASLGGVPIADGRANAMPFNFPNEVAIFGPNSFPGQYVVMDLGRSRLVLFEPETAPQGGEPIPYLGAGSSSALPSLTIEIGDRSIPAILDTGNDSDFLLPLSLVPSLNLEAEPVFVGTATSAAGTQDVFEARLAEDVTIAGVHIERPRVHFMEGGRPNIGIGVLRQLVLMFDPAAERTWVLNR